MKKILAFTLIFFSTISNINADEIKRIEESDLDDKERRVKRLKKR